MLNMKLLEEVIAFFLWYNTERKEKDVFNNSLLLRICCRGNQFTEPLPKNLGGYIYRQTDGKNLRITPLK